MSDVNRILKRTCVCGHKEWEHDVPSKTKQECLVLPYGQNKCFCDKFEPMLKNRKCKVSGCEKTAEDVRGSHIDVCSEHSSTKYLKCQNCHAIRRSEGAYRWSKMRWATISGGRRCKDNKKHEWEVEK